MCRDSDNRDLGTRVGWLLGVCLAASGRFGGAMAVLQPMVADVAAPERRHFAGLAATTIASVNRQLNRFTDARGFDQWATRIGAEDPAVEVDAWMGLAADLVGVGDVPAATKALARAESRYRRGSEWRTTVRLGWVRAEIALVGDDPAQAITSAAAAVELSEASDAPRHVAKSLLFLGAARLARPDARSPAVMRDAELDLRRSAALAQSLGALPILWPACMLLARLHAAAPELRDRDRQTAASALRTIVADLPAPIATEWSARPEIADLLRHHP